MGSVRRVGIVVVLALLALDGAVVSEAEGAPAGEGAGEVSDAGGARVVAAGPAPVSERRDLVGELDVGGGRVSTAGGREVAAGEEVVRVAERVELRSEGSETWSTADGAFVTEFFGQPRWFRGAAGAWERVDPRFEVQPDGSVAAAGVGFSLRFGAVGEGYGLGFEGREARVRLSSVVDAKPELDAADRRVVWWRGVWPGVDVRYTLSGSGVKEDFVVGSAEALKAPGVFGSVLESEGVLVPDERRPGGLVFDWNGNGRVAVDGDGDGPKVALSPPVVTDASGRVLEEAKPVLAVDAGERGAGPEAAGVRRVRGSGVAVDVGALAALPADRFPVVVDPSFEVTPASMGGSWASYHQNGSLSTGQNQWALAGNWRLFNVDDYWRFNVHPGYAYLWTHVAPNPLVFSANLKLTTAEYPTAQAPVFDTDWWKFPTSGNQALARACHASAWSYAGAHPGWDGSKCRDGYFFGYSWTDSIVDGHPSVARVDVVNRPGFVGGS